MSNKSENLLELFNFTSKKWHYLEIVNGSFWDSENTIIKKYKKIKEKLDSEEDDNNEKKEILEESYKVLLNNHKKMEYFRYLMIEYSLSQPYIIDQLINDYYSIIFPYYLFLLRNETNEDFLYCILDYINLSINIYDKNGIKNSFEINEISEIKIEDNMIIIEILNMTQQIELIPQIIDHLDILYLLIIYMAKIKNKRDSYQNDIKKVNEINQNLSKKDIRTLDKKVKENNNYFKEIDISKFNLIPNDCFVPKGIIYSNNVSLEHKQIPDKFLILGKRYIYLFKDETLKDLIIIIPLCVGFTIFDFDNDYRKIDVRSQNKLYSFYINDEKLYEEFKDNLIDIFEGNQENIFEKDDILKCSKAIYDYKILGSLLENTPIFDKCIKNIEKLNKNLVDLSKIKNEIKKEFLINEAISKELEESEE